MQKAMAKRPADRPKARLTQSTNIDSRRPMRQAARVKSLLRSNRLQPKLTVGQPGDKFEREADAVADRVVRMSDADVAQRVETGTVQPLRIQGRCSACAKGEGCSGPEERVRAKEQPGETPQLGAALESRVARLQSGGRPLEAATRSFFEPRFGRQLSDIRIHDDRMAASAASSLNAKAFTIGKDIVFGAEEYHPESTRGKHLLAHEITHVLQQARDNKDNPSVVRAMFEDEPISQHGNANILKTRAEEILREWKSESEEGVNDFVHGELSSRIDSMDSGSWSSFLLSLLGNTIWAATAFLPGIGALTTGARLARATFALSMGGIAVASVTSVPSASSEHDNLATIAATMKDYFGHIFNGLFDQVDGLVRDYVQQHGNNNGRQALRAFLEQNFKNDMIRHSGEPNIDGVAVRHAVRDEAAAVLAHLPTLSGASAANLVPGAQETPRSQIELAGINHRIDVETASHAREILNFQRAHPNAGVLVVILMQWHHGPQGQRVMRQYRSSYPSMDPRYTDRRTAIRLYESQQFWEAVPQGGWHHYRTYHWIPPLGAGINRVTRHQ